METSLPNSQSRALVKVKVLLKVKRLKNMMNLNAFTVKKYLFMKEDK